MWPAAQFFNQTRVLIADQHGFSASYLAHSLTAVGCQLVGPFDKRQSLDDALADDRAQFTGAILALDWLGSDHAVIQSRLAQLGVPYLLIDNAPWRHLAAMQTSFSWPYASFQILEALQQIVVAAPGERREH